MVKTKRSYIAASQHSIINPDFEFQSIKNKKKQSLGALEPGGVENVPTKDNNAALGKDPKVGDCGKGGNFLPN